MSDSQGTINSLQGALKKQKSYAKNGYMHARDAITLLKTAVDDVSNELQNEMRRLNSSTFRNGEINKTLFKQFQDIRDQYLLLPEKLYEDVESLSKKDFNITVFGRTKAGKSTLMETLIKGNGDSIGTGAQRFTRDVRTYQYKGLTITDVPGIAAFEGQKDEAVAYEAAQKSDLILFIITNEDVQPDVAEGMKHILSLGKPVICLINIKVKIDKNNINEKSMRVFRYRLQNAFDLDDIEGIKQQFFEYGASYGQDWHSIKFVTAHLKAAFLSQERNNTVSDEYKSELYKLSHFNNVERAIIKEVIDNGCFYKLKAYTDAVSVPILDAIETLYEQSAQNSRQGIILVKKRRDLVKWRDEFEKDALLQIETFATTLTSNLKREVSAFAEDNYNNPAAGQKWRSIISSWGIEERAKIIIDQLGKECEYEIKEISRQVEFETKYIKLIDEDNSLEGYKIVNGKRIWNWAVTLASGGLTIIGIFGSPLFIWAGIGVGVLGWFGSKRFQDYESKARNARRLLEKKINSNIERTIKKMKRDMISILKNECISNYVNVALGTISDITRSIFTLSDTQYDLATRLNEKLKDINKVTIQEAMSYCGYLEESNLVEDVARLPGYSTVMILKDGTRLPEKVKPYIEDLLKEQVQYAFRRNQYKSIIRQILGKSCDCSDITIEKIKGQSRIAHVPGIDDSDPMIINKVRMTQQATGLLIMK